jgi:hypothetical protein
VTATPVLRRDRLRLNRGARYRDPHGVHSISPSVQTSAFLLLALAPTFRRRRDCRCGTKMEGSERGKSRWAAGSLADQGHYRVSVRARIDAQVARSRAITGPVSSTRAKRPVCIAMTNGMSTLVEAAMMATESAPPGLVAR